METNPTPLQAKLHKDGIRHKALKDAVRQQAIEKAIASGQCMYLHDHRVGGGKYCETHN